MSQSEFNDYDVHGKEYRTFVRGVQLTVAFFTILLALLAVFLL